MRGARRAGGALSAGEHQRRRPVAEQPAGDDVGDAHVLALQGERAQLDREQHRHLVGEGRAARRSPAPSPAAPATQPSPKMGVRLTSGRSPSRFISRASSDGVAIPVTVTKKRWSTSRGRSPARIEGAARTACSPTSSDTRWKASLRSAEALQRAVLLERQGEVAASHLHRAVQLLDALEVEVLASPQFPEGGDQRLLVDPVRGQRGADAATPTGQETDAMVDEGPNRPRPGGATAVGASVDAQLAGAVTGRASSRAPTTRTTPPRNTGMALRVIAVREAQLIAQPADDRRGDARLRAGGR